MTTPSKPITCPKCNKSSGDDWSQCKGSCPMPVSPHYKEEKSVSTKFTPAVRRAIAKYGEAACVRAYELNYKIGEGAYSISVAYALPGVNTTQQANSAINAGAAIVKAKAEDHE